MLLQYHVLKHGLLITAIVSLLVSVFIFFAYPPEERFFRAALGLFLGCYFISLHHFVFRRISTTRSMDLFAAVFLLIPLAAHSWAITQYPEENYAGVMIVALLILASMSFVGHLNFLMFVFACAGLMMFAFFSAGAADLHIGFWLNTLFVAPTVAFLIRVVVQKNYGLLLERLKHEKLLSAKLASTDDALKLAQQDQQQSQFDLKQLDLHLSSLLSNVPIVLSVMDRDGVYTQSRGRGLKRIGLSENELVGKPCEEIYKDHPEVWAAFKKAQQGESSQARTSFAGLTHEIQFRPVFGENQEVISVVGVGLDVSESILVERQKQELESQMLQAQKMNSLGALASGVAHDFNNYLGAIIAFCELLQQPDAINAQSIDPRDIPDEIKKIATNASGVCEQMLMFAGKSTHEKVDVDLSSLVSEMEQFFRAIISNEIKLDIELAQYPVSVNVNRLSIQQSIVNLLKNASEAIKDRPKAEGGRILLSTQIVESLSPVSPNGFRIGELDSKQEQGSFAVLRIEDNGGGIETSDLQRVFEPYFSAKPNGHGFGLAITAGVVKNHHGVIYCESDSSGTRIDLAFPVVEPKDAPVPHVHDGPRATINAAERILLIDDEVMITQSMGLVLEGLGYETTTANSGSIGLQQIDSGKEFDCIIIDFSMPEMNGLEFLAELRERQITTPAIMCSGYFELPGNGGNLPQATLRKPYSIAQLRETIGQVCLTQPGRLVE